MSFDKFRDRAGDFLRVTFAYLGFIDLDDEIEYTNEQREWAAKILHALTCLWLAVLHGVVSFKLAQVFTALLG